MPTEKNAILVKTALLLALALVFQSLRLIFPIPPFISMFLIGTLVNATLAVATLAVNIRAALFISCVAPFIAFLQGQLPLVIFIPVVILGNCVYSILLLFSCTQCCSILSTAILCAVGKTAALFLGLWLSLQLFDIAPPVAKAISFALGWPQLVTGIAGALVAFALLPRLGAARNKY